MKDAYVRRLAMMEMLCAWGHRFKRAFPRGTAGARLFQELRRALDDVRRHHLSQYTGHRTERGSTSDRAHARAELLVQLRAIRATTLALGHGRDLSGHFRHLHRPRDQQLLATARAIAEEVTPNAAAFITHNMPPAFLDDLRTAIERFDGALGRRVDGRAQHVSARTDIRLTIVAANGLIRQLDAAVVNALRKDAVAMITWRKAKCVEKKPGRRKRRKTARRES